MQIEVITLFPEMFRGVFEESIINLAKEKHLVTINIHNLRDFTHDKHKIVDDYPYGGGVGMVLKVEPVFEAVRKIKNKEKGKVILLSPRGQTFTQEKAKELVREERIILICGHYEGVDERIREGLIDEELSIGDYVLTGGELPAMVIIDALVRLIPGVLKKEEAVKGDSFYDYLLEHPQYTRPREYEGLKVPPVLLCGDHQKIRKWRREKSLEDTYTRRPDLLKKASLSEEDKKMLEEIRRYSANSEL